MLRTVLTALPLILMTAIPLWAQEVRDESVRPQAPADRVIRFRAPQRDASEAAAEKIQFTDKQLTVHLTEYQLSSDQEKLIQEVTRTHDLTAVLEKLKQGDNLKQLDSTSLVATENVRASIQSGSQVNLAAGESSGFSPPGRAPVRATVYRQENVGTQITVQWTSRKEKIVLELTYEHSGADPAPIEEGGGTVETQSIRSTLGLRFGETVLVSSMHADGKLKFLTLSVTEHE